MSGFTIDLADSALTPVGSGPVLTASQARVTRKLDQAGTFQVTASGVDPSTAAVLAKRITQIGGLLGTPAARLYSTLGSGVVDSITTRTTMETGEVVFTFSGDDLLGELANTSVLNTALTNGSDGPITVAAAVALIAPFVPTWTIDTTTYASSGTTTNTSTSVTGVTHPENFSIGGPISGTGIPAGTTVANIVGTTITLSAAATASGTVTLAGALFYGTAAGESVLTMLNKIAAAVGHHFRQNGSGRSLIWLYKVQTTSGVRVISAGSDALIDNDEVALIQSTLEVTSDTHDVVTRVYPFGGGNSTARITLNNATNTAPSGYTMHVDADPQKSYIQHTAGVALYGVIERQISFKDASPGNPSSTTATASTGNQVLSQAVEFLRTHVVALKTYRFGVVKLDKAVYPGQTVQLVFRRTVDGYVAVDEDATLVVLDSTLEFQADGATRTTSMTVATTDRRPSSDVDVLVGALTTQQSLDSHTQQAQLVQGLRVAAGETLVVSPGTSPSAGQVLAYNNTTHQYEPTGVAGIGAAPVGTTYITQTPDATLTAEQALSALATGYMKSTTGTGVVSTQATPIPAADGGTGVSNAGTLAVGANATISGGGTISLGGFTLTVPATDTVGMLGRIQTFTALNAFTGGVNLTGQLRPKYVGVAGGATIATSNVFVTCTSTAAPRTFTMPNANVGAGTIYIIKDGSGACATNNITINPAAASGQTFDGAASIVMNVNWQVVRLVSDGTNWLVF